MIKLKSSYVVGTMIERFIARSIMLAVFVATVLFSILGSKWLIVHHADAVKIVFALLLMALFFGICLANCAPSAFEQQNDPNAKDQD